MKANELMIGDWVYIEQGDELAPIKVSCIMEDNNTEWLHPIPLTAEILEKNGWDGIDNYRKYGAAYGVFNDDYKCEIGLEKSGRCFLTINGWEYSICEIKGVHELQHALRLCGLNALADDFKI